MDDDEDVGRDDEGAVRREDAVVTSDGVEQSKQKDTNERQDKQSLLQLLAVVALEPAPTFSNLGLLTIAYYQILSVTLKSIGFTSRFWRSRLID